MARSRGSSRVDIMAVAAARRKSTAKMRRKSEQLRVIMSHKIFKQLNLKDSEVTPAMRTYVLDSCDEMIRNGHMHPADINKVASLASTMLPSAGPKAPQPPASPRKGPLTGRMSPLQNAPEAPVIEPTPPPGGPVPTTSVITQGFAKGPPGSPGFEDHRPTVEPRFNRMLREKDWAARVDSERKRYEEEQRAVAEKRRNAQNSQEFVLRQQMEEAEVRKKNEKLAAQRDMQAFLQQQKEREDEDRKKEKEMKESSRKKRLEIESYMKERTKERQDMLRKQKEEEKEYLARILQEEEAKKRSEKQRKTMNRQELLMFLSGNEETQHAHKRQQELLNELDRKDIEMRQKLMAKQEADADAERSRKDVRGQRLMDRAARIQREYDERQSAKEREEAAHQARDAEEARAKLERERQTEIARQQHQKSLKLEMVKELEEQIADRRAREQEQARIDARHRKEVAQALQLGTTSEQLMKQRDAERKAQMMKVLEQQIREKHRRERHDLQVKI